MTDLPVGTPLGDSPVSASQIKTWKQCPRKWAFQKLGRVPRQETEALAFGSRMHEHAERWLSKAIPPDLSKEGRCFAEGIHLLPAPGSCLVEVRFDYVRDGVPMVAILDWLELPPAVRIGDHKSTSGRQWALDADALRTDTQSVIYSACIIEHFDLPSVTSRWVYYPKRGGSPWPVDILVSRSEAIDREAPLLEIGKTIRSLRTLGVCSYDWINANIEAKPSACDGVGKFCDAASVCAM